MEELLEIWLWRTFSIGIVVFAILERNLVDSARLLLTTLAIYCGLCFDPLIFHIQHNDFSSPLPSHRIVIWLLQSSKPADLATGIFAIKSK